jgi:hypothetical protein
MNMNLATDEGVLNLAGVLLFSEQPEVCSEKTDVLILENLAQ